MVPLGSFGVADRLIARYGPALVICGRAAPGLPPLGMAPEPQGAGRRPTALLSRAMASRSAAASGRSSSVSDSTGPLNQ